MMKIAILAPINNSLYSRILTWACIQEPGIEVCNVVIRTAWSWKRVSGELRRDGPRLLNKVHEKLILGEKTVHKNNPDSLFALATEKLLPGRNLSELCKENNIPFLTVKDHNEIKVVETLKRSKLDAILFTGGGMIRKNILEASRWGVVNCHAGLLPEYRGMDVVEWPLLDHNNDKPEVGLTVHLMDRGVDTGPILLKSPIEIKPGETFEDIRAHLGPHMIDLMLTGLRGLGDATLVPKAQEKDEGRQYFVMHPRVKEAAKKRLKDI